MKNIIKKRKFFLIILLILSNTIIFGKYEPWNYSSVEMGIVKSNSLANAYGSSGKDTTLSIQSNLRYNLLELYLFVDRSNIFNAEKLSDKYNSDSNYIYSEIQPRLSLDGLFNKDFSIGPIKEWFLAYSLDFDNDRSYNIWSGKQNGVEKHNIGIGNLISIPGFDYFKTNLYGRYIAKNYGRNENQWDGYQFSMSYGTTIIKFKNKMKIGVGGWLDYTFKAKAEEFQTSNSFQWFNEMRLYLTDNISLSVGYKKNENFTEVSQKSSDKNHTEFGAHYTYNF
ncbi:MAG: outer membrane protein OmpK [Fusobacteriaceae bacterium]